MTRVDRSESASPSRVRVDHQCRRAESGQLTRVDPGHSRVQLVLGSFSAFWHSNPIPLVTEGAISRFQIPRIASLDSLYELPRSTSVQSQRHLPMSRFSAALSM